MDISKAIAYLKRGELGGSNVAPPKAFLTAETTIGNLCGQVFSHEAAVFYLVDAGDNYTFVTEEMAATADLSDDDLHTLAVANLAEEVESMQLLDLGNSVMFTGSGNFEASAVLVDSLWESLESRFPNGVVAALPSRDVLSVCDRKDADAIATMVSSSAQVWAQVGFVSNRHRTDQ